MSKKLLTSGIYRQKQKLPEFDLYCVKFIWAVLMLNILRKILHLCPYLWTLKNEVHNGLVFWIYFGMKKHLWYKRDNSSRSQQIPFYLFAVQTIMNRRYCQVPHSIFVLMKRSLIMNFIRLIWLIEWSTFCEKLQSRFCFYSLHLSGWYCLIINSFYSIRLGSTISGFYVMLFH